MTTTNNPPGSVQRTDAPNTHDIAADAEPTGANRPALGSETKALFEATEFIVATVVVMLARRTRRLLPG